MGRNTPYENINKITPSQYKNPNWEELKANMTPEINVELAEYQVNERLDLMENYIVRKADKIWDNEEFFENRFGEKEIKEEVLGEGIVIYRDAGLTFYKVQEEDVSKEVIFDKLSNQTEFFYLKSQVYKRNRLRGFNIRDKDLKAGMWIPVPIHYELRKIDIGDFNSYILEGIRELKTDEYYGEYIKEILENCPINELIALTLSIAQQEVGGNKRLGICALNRYEPNHKTFSFGYFHILMKGAGEKARQKLKMTPGQIIHPKNSIKLFLAFLIEKNAKRGNQGEILNINKLLNFFPLNKANVRKFCKMYNGKKPDSKSNYFKNLYKILGKRKKDALTFASL